MAGVRREDAWMKVPALIHLTRLGYTYLPRGSFSRDRSTNILPGTLRRALTEINGREAGRAETESLMEELRARLNRDDQGLGFSRILQEGWRGWKLVDSEHPGKNIFQAAAEVGCGRGKHGFRPDITLFINGLPLVMIEVKTSDQTRGIRAEYDRMMARLQKEEFRPYFQAAQVWAFSNGRENDGGRILPDEGAFFAAVTKGDFPLYAFREMHPTAVRKTLRRDPEAEAVILRDHGLQDRKKTPEWRCSFSPDTPTHQMLTGLFSPERFLFLLKYGILYEQETDQDGHPLIRRRMLSSGQFFALWDLREKWKRGFRSWQIPTTAAAGETGLMASLIRWTGDAMAGSRFYWIASDRKDLLRTDAALRLYGIRTGRRGRASVQGMPVLAEPSEDPESWMQEASERDFEGQRLFLIPADSAQTGRGKRFLQKLRKTLPGAVVMIWHRAAVPERGNFAYMLECADGTLYCGWTNDLEQRLRNHNAGTGAKYTRSRRPVRLVYYEEYGTREEAMSREWHLKKLTRQQKQQLIKDREREKE